MAPVPFFPFADHPTIAVGAAALVKLQPSNFKKAPAQAAASYSDPDIKLSGQSLLKEEYSHAGACPKSNHSSLVRFDASLARPMRTLPNSSITPPCTLYVRVEVRFVMD